MTLDGTFTALADPTRRGVIDLLRTQPRRAGELADQLGLSRPAMSRHLKVLRTTGLIEPASDDADARARVYRLLPEPFSNLRAWLDEVELFWTGQLAAFKAHAEARARALASDPLRGPDRAGAGPIEPRPRRADERGRAAAGSLAAKARAAATLPVAHARRRRS
jgi:DNA-binding transcriptional ArsR family regulator